MSLFLSPLISLLAKHRKTKLQSPLLSHTIPSLKDRMTKYLEEKCSAFDNNYFRINNFSALDKTKKKMLLSIFFCF